MRRVVVLAVLLGMMLAITALQTDSRGAYAPMTLAAIGFVILAAFTVSDIANLLGLPRVTGYIVTGLVLGPSAANILSSEVVTDMKMFNTLTLGLIATGAGLELDFRRLRRVWKTLFTTVGIKVLVSGLMVIGALLGTQALLGSLQAPSQTHIIALALVIGVLSLTTSPAIVLAVLNETRAKGRMSDLAMGAAVLKDIVVVTLLAVVVAISRALLAPDMDVEPAVLWQVGKELTSSVVSGAILGGLLILYIRYVRAEMLLFVAAMILVVSELAMALDLDVLIVFITAGCVVRNFSHHEADLAEPLSMVSLPVFVLFFTNAGANVDLVTTWKILPIALAVCAARAIAFYLSARAGGAIGKESPQIQRHGWLAYLPQAGVTLGLVGLTAQQLPEIAGLISSAGMAMVAVNLLIGPVTLRHALRVTGAIDNIEEPNASLDAPGATSTRTSATSLLPIDPVQQATAQSQAAIDTAEAAIGMMPDEDLREMTFSLYLDLRDLIEQFETKSLQAWAYEFKEQVVEVLDRADNAKNSTVDPKVWKSAFAPASYTGRKEATQRYYEGLYKLVAELPLRKSEPLELRRQLPWVNDNAPGESRMIRVYKRAVGIAMLVKCKLTRRQPQRLVPVRLTARVALQPSLATMSAKTLASWFAIEIGILDIIGRFASGAESRQSVEAKVNSEIEAWLAQTDAMMHQELSTGVRTIAKTLSEIGTPNMPRSLLRYSVVEPRVREALRQLQHDPALWQTKVEAAQRGPFLAAIFGQLGQVTRQAVEHHVVRRCHTAVIELEPTIAQVRNQIQHIIQTVQHTNQYLDTRAIQQTCEQVYSREAEMKVERSINQLRPSASVHQVTGVLRDLIKDLPKQLTVLSVELPWFQLPRVKDVTSRTIQVRELATQYMLWGFLPELEDHVVSTSTKLARMTPRVRDAVDQITEVLESIIDLPPATTEINTANNARDNAAQSSQRPASEKAAKSATGKGVESSFVSTGTLTCELDSPLDAQHDTAMMTPQPADTNGSTPPELLEALREAQLRLQALDAELCSSADALRASTEQSMREVLQKLQEHATGKTTSSSALSATAAQSTPGWLRSSTPLGKHIAHWRMRAMMLWQRLYKRPLSNDLRARLAKQSPDAATIRAYLHRWQSPEQTLPQPPVSYQRLFEDIPVREHRHFSANTNVYDVLMDAEQAWRQGTAGSVLLVGRHGAGRTSLLNMCEIEMAMPRLARLDRSNTPRSSGLMTTLALELGCRARLRHLRHSLEQEQTLILVDDLEQWVTPDDRGVRELEQFLNLIVHSHKNAFWLVTINAQALSLLEETVSIRGAFHHVVQLAELKPDELMRAVQARHNLSGLVVRYPSTWATPLLGKLRQNTDRDMFFRTLCSQSEGNVQRAFSLWIRSASVNAKGEIELQFPPGFHLDLPFIGQMSSWEIALLVHIARFGSMTATELATCLGIDLNATERHIAFLLSAGLVERLDNAPGEYHIPRAVRPPILYSLRSLGAWS